MTDEAKALLKEFAASVVDRAKTNVGAFRNVKNRDGKRRQIRRVSSSQLKNALTYSLSDNGKGKISLRFYAKGPAGKYADVIERGRQPGRKGPPPGVIEKWIAEKPLRLRDLKTGAFVKSTPRGIKSAAFLIGRSMAKYGFEGIFFFAEALNDELDDRGISFFQGLPLVDITKIKKK